MNQLTNFEKQLKAALKQFHLPEALGADSPLASFYFLGHLLTDSDDAVSPLHRGKILQRELRMAAEQLWQRAPLTSADDVLQQFHALSKQPESDSYAYLILELRCLHNFLKPKKIADIWESILPGSRAEHYRDYDRAITKLGQRFLQRVQPTFRLEQPSESGPLLGYLGLLEEAQCALKERKSVAVYGSGGTGKTAFGAALAATYPSGHCFWFTIRPTLNDRLESMLFALGYFLHQRGASNLWHMLLVHNGKIDNLALASGLVREDLAILSDRTLLLCFDELEQLHVVDPERTNPLHHQIVQFLESLRGEVAMVFMGQQPSIDAETYFELRGLIAPDIARLFGQVELKLSMEQVDQLAAYTGGNPRLLCLYRLLCEQGEALDILLHTESVRPELYPVFQRLWRRLSPQEQQILQELAVFRSMAPAEQWAEESAIVKRLVDQGLVQWSGPGAIVLVSAIRNMIYQSLPPEERELLHTVAAAMRADRAEYTAAAYHLCRAGDESTAIQLWYTHMAQEIQRGQAGAALTIFAQISSRQLEQSHREALAIVRAELQFLHGNISSGLATLQENDWCGRSERTVRALGLQGKFHQELGAIDDAVTCYQQAEAVVYDLLQQVTEFHHLAGVAFLRQQRKADARRKADLAHYHAHCLSGNVHEIEGDYGAALDAYHQALTLAQRSGDASHQARVHRLMARLYTRQQNFSAAIEEANRAIAYYEIMGDRTNQEVMRNLMGSIYLETGAYAHVIDILSPTIAYFRRIKHSHFVAAAAANLAEAYLKSNDLRQARAYANEALQLDEPYTYSHAQYTLGLVSQAEYDLDAAEGHLQQSASFAQENQDPYLEAHANHALAKIYQERGMVEQQTQAHARAEELAGQLGLVFAERSLD
ncbi:MAG TPA: tetratricopeptide repeat protein [Caldilineaceae bacterium]|nr:tetratricopeptide repeat protein [Caldilineaceae bacterium]